MKQISLFIALAIFLFLVAGCNENATEVVTDAANQTSKKMNCQILIAGGGASGVMAAIEAARGGAKVLIVEETPWLGGMLTSAGVSAIDGNHKLPSGLWGEFRAKLYNHYGGAKAVETGWVSNTLFEPSVGNKILNDMVDNEPNIKHIHDYHVVDAIVEQNRILGARFKKNDTNDTICVYADISIDATELGDLLALSGVKYSIGQDSKEETGEEIAPEKPSDIIQDITYVAILKDYGKEANKTIAMPEGYTKDAFNCTCKEVCSDDSIDVVDCITALDYGRLPNNKFMINWPINGNDYYVNAIEMDYDERQKAFAEAKLETLRWIYFMQTEAGFKHLGLANDEFNTEDLLAYIPYHRESRRIYGITRFTLNDILSPYGNPERPLYKQAVAVGDYPVDHHHKKNPKPVYEDEFPDIPSFSIPFGSFIPKEIDGLIVAEKSISVTHLANGSTRLQPVVMQIGQVAGAAAAICVKSEKQPRELNIRNLQQKLLAGKCWLMPYFDIQPDDKYFNHIQMVTLCGIMKGKGVPYKWANQTWFYPDSVMNKEKFELSLQIANNNAIMTNDTIWDFSQENAITKADAVLKLWESAGKPQSASPNSEISDIEKDSELYHALQYVLASGGTEELIDGSKFSPKSLLKRKDAALLFNILYKPFDNPLVFK